jgi:hypothetical protein
MILPSADQVGQAELAPPSRTPLENLVNKAAKEIGLYVLAGLADSVTPGGGQVVRLLAGGLKVVRVAEGLSQGDGARLKSDTAVRLRVRDRPERTLRGGTPSHAGRH